MIPDREWIRSAPKVLLHDHLDGGLRPATLLELADACGHTGLPADDPETLGAAFVSAASEGGLPGYLSCFEHTLAVLQDAEALRRVAREAVLDYADEGIVYAEIRFAPTLHCSAGLDPEEALDAVLDGLREGEEETGTVTRAILCALRTAEDSMEVAELALARRDNGVVGFDLAGEEAGYPAKRHLAAFQLVHRENFFITIHAGEAYPQESIWQALQWCGAHRIGHGVRVADDLRLEEDGSVADMGPLARYVLDTRVPLEMCPTSNLHTGAADSIHHHPFGPLFRARFRVTLNTDNRLISGITLTDEFVNAVDAFGLDRSDVAHLTANAMKSSFLPFEERRHMLLDRIFPAYAELGVAT